MEATKRGCLQLLLGAVAVAATRLYLRLAGKTVRKADVPEYDGDGRFRHVSWGKRFGDAGFYRVLDLDAERLKVRYLRTLRERFDVHSDEDGVLRCDHGVRFLGITMLRLHYRMRGCS